MRQLAEDFLQESRVLAACLADCEDGDFERVTQFKGWTLNDVLGHLHFFNAAAEAALHGEAVFDRMMAPATDALAAGGSILSLQGPWLDGLAGRALLLDWQQGAERLAATSARLDPKTRVKWVGPSMSVLSAMTARQMETWAHGQEIFDLLGIERLEADRIRNIAHLGVLTFGWSFQVRGEPVPDLVPHVVLTAPSGAIWSWNEPQDDNRVTGSAVDFARVVTQVRHIADTSLEVSGPVARAWMEQAQCFAGPPVSPPAPGSRYRVIGTGG